jgi:sulfur dioxygenase
VRSRQAVLIDPVLTMVERDLSELTNLGFSLAASLDTHIHADHITGALELKRRTGSRIAAQPLTTCPAPMWPSRKGGPFRLEA